MEPSPAPPPSATSVNTSPPPMKTSKLRLMCSYGGHIVPRPMDKTLCYAGGETRIVALDRKSAFSLSSLTAHLSKALLNGKPFTLKYQLPNHELDSLISVSTDEDLANMIEEHDRLSASPSRLRFFLFHDLHDPTSEDWFIDALRNVGVVTKERSSDSESEGKVAAGGGGSSLLDSATSLPESIVLEKNSSFGSTSSSASASNSPAIRSGGGVGDGGGGGGEEGARIRFQEFKAALPLIDSISSDSSLATQMFSPQGIVYHDASGFHESKPVPPNFLETESNASDLPTHVQVSGYVLSKPIDQQHQQLQPAQSSATPQPPSHQQYIHPASQTHYVTQYYPSPTPVASYHPTMYQPYVQTHQPIQYQINSPYGFPVYMIPVGQSQNPCEMSMQSTMATAHNIPQGGHPQVLSNPVMAASPMFYDGYTSATPRPEYTSKVYRIPLSDDHLNQPQMPTSPITVSSPTVFDGHKPSAVAPEYAAKVYKTSAMGTPPVNLPSDDHHHHHHQVVASSPPLENASYGGEYEDPMHAQIYKTQPTGPTLPSQLQTAGNATKVMLSETFAQLHVDNTTKH